MDWKTLERALSSMGVVWEDDGDEAVWQSLVISRLRNL